MSRFGLVFLLAVPSAADDVSKTLYTIGAATSPSGKSWADLAAIFQASAGGGGWGDVGNSGTDLKTNMALRGWKYLATDNSGTAADLGANPAFWCITLAKAQKGTTLSELAGNISGNKWSTDITDEEWGAVQTRMLLHTTSADNKASDNTAWKVRLRSDNFSTTRGLVANANLCGDASAFIVPKYCGDFEAAVSDGANIGNSARAALAGDIDGMSSLIADWPFHQPASVTAVPHGSNCEKLGNTLTAAVNFQYAASGSVTESKIQKVDTWLTGMISHDLPTMTAGSKGLGPSFHTSPSQAHFKGLFQNFDGSDTLASYLGGAYGYKVSDAGTALNGAAITWDGSTTVDGFCIRAGKSGSHETGTANGAGWTSLATKDLEDLQRAVMEKFTSKIKKNGSGTNLKLKETEGQLSSALATVCGLPDHIFVPSWCGKDDGSLTGTADDFSALKGDMDQLTTLFGGDSSSLIKSPTFSASGLGGKSPCEGLNHSLFATPPGGSAGGAYTAGTYSSYEPLQWVYGSGTDAIKTVGGKIDDLLPKTPVDPTSSPGGGPSDDLADKESDLTTCCQRSPKTDDNKYVNDGCMSTGMGCGAKMTEDDAKNASCSSCAQSDKDSNFSKTNPAAKTNTFCADLWVKYLVPVFSVLAIAGGAWYYFATNPEETAATEETGATEETEEAKPDGGDDEQQSGGCSKGAIFGVVVAVFLLGGLIYYFVASGSDAAEDEEEAEDAEGEGEA